MKFADIPGHEDVKAHLRSMADSGRVPHALLLEGPAGAGKFALARAFARYIHCTGRRPGDTDSCGCCASCRQHDAFNHIDTVYCFPVVKKGGKPALSDDYIGEFRDFMAASPFMDFDRWLRALDNINAQPQIYVEEGNHLLHRLTYMARQSSHKVVLLWLPERLKEETANKLLKLVEEPYGDTVFVMVSDAQRRILGTIYSRTQRVGVKAYSDGEIVSILAGKGVSADAAAGIAAIAEGNVNKALQLAEVSEERMRCLDLFIQLMRKAYARKVGELRQWSADAASLGREPLMQFIDYSTRLIRESLMMHLRDSSLLTLDRDECAFVSKFFPFINEKNVIDMTDLFDKARRDIAANGNARIILFDLAVRIIILIRRK
ncbi:MAG: DNA polymerase III subunit delta [Muribaculaceae bacterium]|nr:DNA polymerase III subunit delta [Muribaculaceae bacterium]